LSTTPASSRRPLNVVLSHRQAISVRDVVSTDSKF
jgi:hypothetical protein